jgi:hypothetical protein
MSVCSCQPRPDAKGAYYNQLNEYEKVFYDKHLDLFKKIEFRFFSQMGQKFIQDVSPEGFPVGKLTQMIDLVSSLRRVIDFTGKSNPKRLMMMAFVDYVEKKIN